jgi:hypothetical protein
MNDHDRPADATALTASSADARTFAFTGSGPAPAPGDLVVLALPDGDRFLGQVMELSVAPDASTAGDGLLLGALAPDDVLARDGRRSFPAASMDPAPAALQVAVQQAAGARLEIGSRRSGGAEVPAALRAQGFGRHTFLCGQSGSGKTYALGVILEQILLGTDLRMVVLDPNADFVRLGEPRPDAPPAAAARLSASDIHVLGADSTTAQPLRMRFATMPREAQTAVLRLDPLADRAEYNLFLHLIGQGVSGELDALVTRLLAGDDDQRAMGQRVENLGLPQWEVWAQELPSAAEVMAAGARATVLNLSGFRDPREPVAVSLDLIERLWAQRETRTPTLIVIDEAHNLCPAEPTGSLQQALVERLIQIAAEGRKYGLWLLLSTQRPSKIHPQVLSQCDNLVLMRMNSPGDVAELAEVFGFAPPAMLRASKYFVQGEALVAGGFVPTPAIVRMGARMTFEGGSDVAVPLA